MDETDRLTTGGQPPDRLARSLEIILFG